MAELKRKADEGTRTESSKERQTVAQFMRTWLAGLASTPTRQQTRKGYESVIDNHIIPALGRIKLTELRPDAIQKMYATKLIEQQKSNHNKPLTPYTVRKIHEVLHRALETAVEWNYIARNPADRVKRPAAPHRDLDTFGS